MSNRILSIMYLFFLISLIFISKDVFAQTCTSCPTTCQINCGQTLTNLFTAGEDYFSLTLTETKTVTITMTPASSVDYDLYVKYTKDVCPSLSNYNCPSHYGMGVPESCTQNLESGTYYIMVKGYPGYTGTFSLSVNCGETTSTTTSTFTTSPTTTSVTTSTTTGSTTTSQTTSTTSQTTSTSTIGSTTTSSTTSTSTTSTVPLITLTCKNSTIYVKQSNECDVTGCNNGNWLISNFQNNPLEEGILSSNIPPNKIVFGPTKEIGKVITSVICYNPYIMVNHTTNVIRGPNLICSETCYVGESCKCEIYDCEKGVLLMNNHEGDVLEADVIKDFTDTEFDYEFTTIDEGKIRARMFCYKPYETRQEVYINITPKIVTTTTPGEFQLSNVICSKDECTLNVNKNNMDDAIRIFIKLIKEPEGIIYYSGKYTTMSGSTGIKTALLEMDRTCVNGTKLKMLVIAYPYSNTGDRLARIKSDAFTC